jgi:hypothetical protein
MPATDYMRRAYRCSNLARGAGFTSIDRGADPRVGPTCFALRSPPAAIADNDNSRVRRGRRNAA